MQLLIEKGGGRDDCQMDNEQSTESRYTGSVFKSVVGTRELAFS